MTKEVEMKDAAEVDAGVKKGAEKVAAEESPAVKCKKVLVECTHVLGSAVTAKETKLLAGRVLRKVSSIRKDLDASILKDFVSDMLPSGSAPVALLLNALSKVCSPSILTNSPHSVQHPSD
jgi:hypothetical protein